MAEIILLVLVTIGLLPKAALEAMYFQDRQSARKTLFVWGIIAVTLGAAFCLSLLVNYTI